MRSIILFVLGHLVLSSGAICQAENYTMTVEEYAVDGVAGQTTYRLYIDMANPDDFLSSAYGNVDVPFSLTTTTSFYNDAAATGGSAGGVNPSFLLPPFSDFFPGLGYDSWFTIGIEYAPSGAETAISALESATQPWIGCFDATSAIAGQNVLMDDTQGGAWYVLNGTPNGLPDAENQRVLFAQLTTDGELCGVVNVQLFENGVGANDVRPRFEFCGTGTFPHTVAVLVGCTNESACNYQVSATEDDGSCLFPDTGFDCDGVCLNDADGDGICDEFEVFGCTDSEACNFNELATEEDLSCSYLDTSIYISCDGECIEDYDGDGVCNQLEIPGCTIPIACNYNPEATDDDNSCEFYCPGCTDPLACNYDPDAIQSDGSCIYPIDLFGDAELDCDGECLNDSDGDGICDHLELPGCPNPEACNFQPEATDDDGSCVFADEACEECNENGGVDVFDADGDGICDEDEILGCTDASSCTFLPEATDEDDSCAYPSDLCGESWFDCDCQCLNDADGDGVCDEAEIVGCTDPIACNYDAAATDPGPCETVSCSGCTYPFACNFDPEAVYNDGTCEFGTCPGCTNPSACNFNPTVTEDDGSCAEWDECGVCGGSGPELGYNCDGSCQDSDGDGVCDFDESGCTDASACNFDPLVNDDDGSCQFPDDCFDCSGECWDENANDICDCSEIYGCMDAEACNFEPQANLTDNSCTYPDPFYDCLGSCLNDLDEDGICDELDDCPNDPNNDADSDGICADDEVMGCTNPEACNYDPASTDDDGSCVVISAIEEAAILEGYSMAESDLLDSLGAGNYCGDGTYWDDALSACVPSACFGDFNGDGMRGTEDLLQFLTVFDTPCPSAVSAFTCGDSVGFDGYDYQTVQIGSQCWFAENLRTTHYANGDPIPGNLSDSEWTTTTSGATTVYGEGTSSVYSGSEDEVANLENYGRLYNWYAVDDSRGLCPSGWHVPTDEEWMTLEMELGMTSSEVNSIDWRGTNQGAQLRSSPTDNPSWNGTNTSGFSALPGGLRYNFYGYFGYEANYGYWWSSSQNATWAAWSRYLYSDNDYVFRNYYDLRLGFSVRCLRDP